MHGELPDQIGVVGHIGRRGPALPAGDGTTQSEFTVVRGRAWGDDPESHVGVEAP